MAEEEEKST
jgi:hypothetical protein